MLPAESFGSLRLRPRSRIRLDNGMWRSTGAENGQETCQGTLSMLLTSKQEMSRLLVRAVGGVLILRSLRGGARAGKSIVFLGVLVGFLLLIFPDKRMKP